MRLKQILRVVVTFGLTGVLYAQSSQPQTQPAMQPQDPAAQSNAHPGARCDIVRDDYMAPITSTQKGMLNQAVMRRQLEDQTKAPALMTEKEVMRDVESGRAETVAKEVHERGVDFDLTHGTEKKLRKANASDEVIEAVRQAGPKVRAQIAKMILGPSSVGAQNVRSEEARPFSAILTELDADKSIKLVDDFAKRYPDSPLLSMVYSFGANAYQQKGDVEKVVAYTGRSLQLNPDNLTSLILRIEMLPMPQYLRSHPADRTKILQEAENDAKRALQLTAQIPKQPYESDAQYQKRLDGFASEIYGPLGTVHLELASGGPAGLDRGELAKAEKELSSAVSSSANPDPRDCYRLGEAYALDGKWDDAIQAFKKAGGLGQGTLIKTYADDQIAQMKKRKAQDAMASR
jgi:tetratricopeptide (TPR) repeat protein